MFTRLSLKYILYYTKKNIFVHVSSFMNAINDILYWDNICFQDISKYFHSFINVVNCDDLLIFFNIRYLIKHVIAVNLIFIVIVSTNRSESVVVSNGL